MSVQNRQLLHAVGVPTELVEGLEGEGLEEDLHVLVGLEVAGLVPRGFFHQRAAAPLAGLEEMVALEGLMDPDLSGLQAVASPARL